MKHPHVANPTPNHVRAVFANSAAFFDLPRVTTFEQLAERLCSLGEHYNDPLTSIDFVTEPSADGSHLLAALIRRLTALEDEATAAP
jgi:hypothetical protein